MRRILFTFFFSLQLSGALLQAQTVIYVSPTGNGDGSSWVQASSLADAVDNAVASDELWLAQGVYEITETLASNISSFSAGISMYGGFDETETTLNQRDYENNETILDGLFEQRIIYADHDITVDGITFQNGFVEGEYEGGGAIYGRSGVILRNCVFRDNISEGSRGAGAVFAWGSFSSELLIDNCLFENNRTQSYAGSANGGGAIHIWMNNTFIRNSTFKDNASHNTGGAIYTWSGNTVSIDVCVFENNESDGAGGAINTRSILNLSNTVFIGNSSAGTGGAIYNGEELTVNRTTFTDNVANSNGGAIHNGLSSTATVANAIFNNNRAANQGGAIYNAAGLSVSNATFVGNQNQAIAFIDYTGASYFSRIYNNIFYNNTSSGGLSPDIFSTRTWDDSFDVDIRRNILQVSIGNPNHGSNNLVGIDPVFQGLSGGDFSLQSNSPAIEYGRNTFYTAVAGTVPASDSDLAGNNRLFGDHIDAGAYEHQSTSTLTPPSCTTLSSPADGDTNVAVTSPIQWNAAAEATGYRISIGTSSGATDIEDNLDVGNTTTYAPSIDLPENASIYLTVVPYNTAGDAVGCSEESFTVETLVTVPGCATNITPANNATDVPVDADMTWDAVAGADGYYVIIGTAPGGSDIADNVDVSSTSYNPPTDFPENETIYVTVVPYNAAGEATGCSEISFTTETLLTAPDCAVVTSPTHGGTDVALEADITWEPADDADGYRIYIGTSLGGADVVNGEEVTGTTYTYGADWEEDTEYYVRVVPFNAAGEATGCPEISFTTVARPEPPQADDQQFCPPATVADLIAVGTDIRWYGQATGGSPLSATTALSTGTYYATQTVGGLESDRRTVTVAVESPVAPQFNSDITGCGSLTVADLEDVGTGLRWYNQVTGGTALSPTTALSSGTYYASRVSGTCESDRTAVQVTISVTPVPDVPDQTFVAGSTFADLNVIGQNLRWYMEPSGSTPFDPQTVINNGTYYVSQTIDGCESDRVIVQINIASVPGCATNIMPANNATDVPVDVDITWDAVAGADGYRVFIGTSFGDTDVVDGVEVTGTTFSLASGWDENTTYYVTVIPFNAVAEATGCVAVSFTTEELETVPPVPECTTIIRPQDGERSSTLGDGIAWVTVDGADGYRVSIGTTPGGTDVVNNVLVTGTTFTPIVDFVENTPYFLSVIPFNAAGEAAGCATLRFVIIPDTLPEPEHNIKRTKYGISPNGDGINDFWEIDGVEHYPDNMVSIYNRWGDLVFQLKNYDNQSRVFNGNANKLNRLGGGMLPSGTYFFAIQYRDSQETKKVEGMLVIKR